MPYDIRRHGSQYEVVDDSGQVVGRHATRAEAIRHQRALYANVPDARKSIKDTWRGIFSPRVD